MGWVAQPRVPITPPVHHNSRGGEECSTDPLLKLPGHPRLSGHYRRGDRYHTAGGQVTRSAGHLPMYLPVMDQRSMVDGSSEWPKRNEAEAKLLAVEASMVGSYLWL